MGLTARVLEWQSRGERVGALGDHRVFVVRRPGSGTPLVLLHGFPSSSFDWRAMIEQPAPLDREVLMFDFLGFGLSDKPPGPYSLNTQADLVAELVARYTDGKVFLVAHDMGTSVATELLAREIDGKPGLGDVRSAAVQRQHAPAPRQPHDWPTVAAEPGRQGDGAPEQ